ncbi:MAG: NAD-dependent succinate-semialdehyde dehydrogenase [Candidatus Kapabacteria bacterium]|nr:NAD-dependent succinate-semialdehyde dehydrogenase [Candidatus Kapabacteria bacterium]
MTFISFDPSTEKIVAEFPEHAPNDVEKIIASAAAAQHEWSKTSIAHRAAVVVSLAKVLDDHRDMAARQITLEMGKPLPQARAEVEKCAGVCRYMATIAPSVLADEIVNAGFRESRVRAEPLGLILSIMPWNFPMWQFFRFAAPALIAGNGVLLKHAPSTMGCALMAVDLCRKAGIPDGLVSALLINVPQVESVIAHPLVSAVTFTGSTKGGSSVAELAGRYIKRTVLELGGSDAYVVLDDADLDVAVNACVTGRLLNAGQSCIGAKRYLVHSSIHDEFVERTSHRFDAAIVGPPMEASTEVGPLARADLRQTLLDQVSRSLTKGARVATHRTHSDVPSTGWYVPPMLLVNVDSTNPAFREELFGPVATVTRFDTDAEAVRLANDSVFGLGAAVFSADHNRATAIAEQLHVGTVFINEFVRSHSALPFGGVKQSGYGRELGRWGMLEFVNVKNITTG